MSPGRDGLPNLVPVHLPKWDLNVIASSSDCKRKAQVGASVVSKEVDIVVEEF